MKNKKEIPALLLAGLFNDMNIEYNCTAQEIVDALESIGFNHSTPPVESEDMSKLPPNRKYDKFLDMPSDRDEEIENLAAILFEENQKELYGTDGLKWIAVRKSDQVYEKYICIAERVISSLRPKPELVALDEKEVANWFIRHAPWANAETFAKLFCLEFALPRSIPSDSAFKTAIFQASDVSGAIDYERAVSNLKVLLRSSERSGVTKEDIVRVMTDNYATCDDKYGCIYCPICATKTAAALITLLESKGIA